MVNENEKNVTKNIHRVLARKYRPLNFTKLVGQENLVKTLSGSIERGRVAHAYILTGVRGVGKTSTARIIAKLFNCINPEKLTNISTNPCGVCESCSGIAEGKNIDVLEIDAASNTGVDNIRELIDGIGYKPLTSKFIGKYPLTFPLIFEFPNLICLLPFIAGAIIQLCSLFSANASASFITKGLKPDDTPPRFLWLGKIDNVLGPRSSILASKAFSALDPIPITAITAAVPIIIANAVKNDLIPFDLIEEIAEFIDSSTSIIRN